MGLSGQVLALGGEFPAADRARWEALVADVLRRSGRGPLPTESDDGIPLLPLYTAADAPAGDPGMPGRMPFVRGATVDGAARSGWDVRVRHADPDARRTNAAVLADLNGGARSLWLVLGVAGLAVADLADALAGVDLAAAAVVLDAGAETPSATEALLSLGDGRLAGSLGADPIGRRARTGADADLGVLATLAARAGTQPGLRVATVDATAYHDAGGSAADEIAAATSVGVAYLRAFTAADIPVDRALELLEFRFAATADQFRTVAKLRAARRVWARVAELCEAAPDRRGQHQHAVTSAPMMSRRDPWANLLRTTIACFAAAVGGAEAITVRPFDDAIGLPDELARRLARNTQAVLHDEASLGRVIDPAGGSWYVETLTEQLAEAAWAGFTGIERAGGAVRALDDGVLGEILAGRRAGKIADLATRRAPIVGVSQYALPADPVPVRDPAPPAPSGGPLPFFRPSDLYESLRDRTEEHARTSGTRPTVYLAALGPARTHTGRVAFATGVFRAAGLEVVVGTGGPDDLVEGFLAAGTPVACLCASDQVYADSAGSDAAALKAAGARYLWLTGRPGGGESADRAAGVDGYLFRGCDVLDALRTTLELLEIP